MRKNTEWKKRPLPENRKKYAAPETRKELIERLGKEKKLKRELAEMEEEVKKKNKNEFHFGYYSRNRSMVKKEKLTEDELKKKLKYVECEITKYKRKIRASNDAIEPLKKDNSAMAGGKGESIEEYRRYVEELENKRDEIWAKIKEAQDGDR